MYIENKNGCFSTTNTSLAAYLSINGFQIKKVDIKDYPASFHFENTTELQTYVTKYETWVCDGNIRQYHDEYRRCLRLTRSGK